MIHSQICKLKKIKEVKKIPKSNNRNDMHRRSGIPRWLVETLLPTGIRHPNSNCFDVDFYDVRLLLTTLLFLIANELFQKKKKHGRSSRGGLRTYFFKIIPGSFRFLTLPVKTPDKTNLHPLKLQKNVLQPLETWWPKNKVPGKSTWLFLKLKCNKKLVNVDFTSRYMQSCWPFNKAFWQSQTLL